MRLLITGGAGFLGSLLARTLLKRGELDGRHIGEVVLADLAAPADASLRNDPRVQSRVGDLTGQLGTLMSEPFDVVFHLASAVSGECEADFDLGLRSNLDTTRALLDACRAQAVAGQVPRFIFSSSVAVFGSDAAVPMPPCIEDHTLPTPQSSYGIQKFICEQLVADYTRKGYIDGRAARLMTVSVRPGRPNRAASGFLSGIVREPLAGQVAVCPVSPEAAVALGFAGHHHRGSHRRGRGFARSLRRPYRNQSSGAQRHRARDARCIAIGGWRRSARPGALRT